MNDQIIGLISAVIGGGGLSALLTYISRHKDRPLEQESVYATHLKDLFDRVDKLTEKQDSLLRELDNERYLRQKKEIENLKLKDEINILKKHIDSLGDKIDKLQSIIDSKEN